MPEGDTVWRTAARLRAGLEGQVLTHTDFRVPEHATRDFSGETVDSVVSRGKHLLIRVGGHSIHSHLKMEGRWDVHPLGTRWRQPGHAARIVLRTDATEAVGFWLAQVSVVPTDAESELVGHLGPDLLGPDWQPELAAERLSSQPQQSLFVALHDQRNLAGLGNEYVNELLFILGYTPDRPVADADLHRVSTTAHRVIVANRDRSGRTFTGNTAPGQRTWVYGRERDRCRRCGTAIKSSTMGRSATQQRNVFWCPSCQT